MSYICADCPRNCKIDRDAEVGFCGVKSNIVVAKVIKNFMWEEPSLCFDKGVTAIFFSGCNLKCEFCQNEKISRASVGDNYTIEEFARVLESLDCEDTDGLDFISPTQFSGRLLEVFKLYNPKHKVIWNSNGYEKVELIERLSKYVDVFLPDFKYHNNEMAQKISKVTNYRKTCIDVIRKMCEIKPVVFSGVEMKQGVIVRHLILPDETKDSIAVIDDISMNFPDVYVSLMSQFVPIGKGCKQRKITPLEYKIVLSHFRKAGLVNGYFQEMEASSDQFIPNF